MVDGGEITDAQLFETLGVVGLWTRSVVGAQGAGIEIEQIVRAFVEAMRETYPGDDLPLSQRIHVHIEEALRENPALVRFRGYVEAALRAYPHDDAAITATNFLAYATARESNDEVLAYFDVLTAGL